MSPAPKPLDDLKSQPLPAQKQPEAAQTPSRQAASAKDPDSEPQASTQEQAEGGEALIRVEDQRPEGYQGDCLRPMGLCELGGCCDLCWYGNPELRRADKSEDKS